MARSTLFLAIQLLIVATASGQVVSQSIRVVPPSPDTHDFVKLELHGVWSSACTPRFPHTTVREGAIDVRLRGPASGGCTTSSAEWGATANLGVLPAGGYDVSVKVNDRAAGEVDLGTLKVIVRGADDLTLSMLGGTIAGGTSVLIEGDRLLSDSLVAVDSVDFGGAAATVVDSNTRFAAVKTPPHGPGPVDVSVHLSNGSTILAKTAFTYFDPDAPPDPFVHEPILFPLSYSGPGAYGSQWTTESVILGLFKNALPCHECARSLLDTDSDGTGWLLYAIRSAPLEAVRGGSSGSSRIQDLSTGRNAGAEVHIVRENDWLDGHVALLNVPPVRNSRALLRVYALSDEPLIATVRVVGNDPAVAPQYAVLTRRSSAKPFYATSDVTSALQQLGEDNRARIDVTCRDVAIRCWAFLTITNNVSQQVTVISPQ